MQTICFVNQKGGVGKTTSCLNIGAALQKLLEEVAAEKLPNQKDDLMKRAGRLYHSGFGR